MKVTLSSRIFASDNFNLWIDFTREIELPFFPRPGDSLYIGHTFHTVETSAFNTSQQEAIATLKSLEVFVSLKHSLENGGYATGKYHQSVKDGATIKERAYSLTKVGRKELLESRRFYE